MILCVCTVLIHWTSFFFTFPNRVPDGKAPRFPKKPTIKQVDDNLIMECVLEANPLPEITWFRGTQKISESKRIIITKTSTGKDTYLLLLEIKVSVKQVENFFIYSTHI